MNVRDELIESLSHELEPVSPVPGINALAALWVLLSTAYVVAMTYLLGPIRPGAISQLIAEPRFLLESLLGVAAIIWISVAAFRAAIPASLSKSFAMIGTVLLSLWLTQYVIGLVSPALEASTLGKRGHCYFETMAYSLPPILIGLYLIRRLYPLRFTRTSMTLSLAAGMIPALYMQLACMYEPLHILGFHILPGLAMVLVGAVASALWPPQRNGYNKR